MTIGTIIDRPEEASRGSFQAIKKLEGLFVDRTRVEGKFEDEKGRKRDQIKVDLEDVVILEMFEGEDEPDLEDGKFSFYLNYALAGKDKAHANTFYVKGFLTSAVALAKARGIENGSIPELLNTRVVMEYLPAVPLFKIKRKNEEGEPEEEVVTGRGWVFSASGADEGIDIEEHIKSLVINANKSNALRLLMGDNRVKRDPQWKQALNDGTLADKLGITFVDGVFK